MVDEAGRRLTGGITLIELLGVLAILGILVVLVVPSYTVSVRQARRLDATSSLFRVGVHQERYRAGHPRYAVSLSELGWTGDVIDSPAGYYRIELVRVADPVSAFRAQAVPRPGTDQARDTCQRFVLDQDGPDLTASSGPGCWVR